MAKLFNNLLFGALAITLALVSAAQADDWSAEKLRGPVVELVDGQWLQVKRGTIIPDDRMVRTMAAGYVTFKRGQETVELGPNTQIQIFDRAGKKPFTTVKQYFGSVSVEADVRNVQHFAVDTPFLAAVVKGTRFTVVSGETSSKVTVRRGHVAVQNLKDRSNVLLSVGQSATVDGVKGSSIVVSGSGKLPVVLGANGKPLVSVTSSGGSNSVNVNAGNLASVSAGSLGIDVNAANLADVSVGSSGIGVKVGGIGVGLGKGSGKAGSGSGSSGSGSGNSGSGGSSGSGSIINLHIGKLHIGL